MADKHDHWKVSLTPEEETRLDLELIEELNEKYEVEEEYDEPDVDHGQRNGRLKLVGLITVLIFTAFILGNWLQVFRMPPMDFLGKSFELARDPKVKELQLTVVTVNMPGIRGTGFNIDSDGLIVTNFHVVKDGRAVEVGFLSRGTYLSNDWLGFPEVDLALVNIPGENLPVVELAKEYEVETGEQVLIIGNPLGFPQIITQGEVVGRHLLPGWDEPIVMVKGPIHPGSSGSPVFNQDGQVVAVIFATFTLAERDDEGLVVGLAVPINILIERLNDYMEEGAI